MYIVSKAYDDKSAVITDIMSGRSRYFQEGELVKFHSHTDVMGLSVSNGRVNYVHAYSVTRFPVEDEATEYCREEGIGFGSKMLVAGTWCVFEKNEKVGHVAYYVTNVGCADKCYACRKNGKYVTRRSEADEYSKKEAMDKAFAMTRNSKTGQKWVVETVVMD